eukprot:GEMP01038465.1.p1 GENE.GEMP01038465.1~~GEMP01038465.1.p1  ORF type:complete len:449 (+),score=110.04 GEMP01038465.1:133-1479(+)
MVSWETKTKENLLCHLQIDESASTTSNHLAGLLGEVLREKPKDALNKLEVLSAFLKRYRFHPTPAPDTVVPTPVTQQRLNAMEALQRSKVRYTGKAEIRNFGDDTEMLRWAGISFGDQTNYDLTLRVQTLAESLGTSLVNLRFWGKMLGTSYDYFIVEGQLTPRTVEVGGDIEPRGQGANTWSYWALSSKPGSEWALLPNVRPGWIITSKPIRKYLTGDLDAEVLGFVSFPAKERAYLRALIARISAACVLAPTGAFLAAEEDGIIQENPEFEFPPSDDLKTQAPWIHARAHLLPNGKTQYPTADEGDEELALEIARQSVDDPLVARLRGIAEDEPAEEGGSTGWIASQAGDSSKYLFDGVEKSYAVGVIRSTRWPGAYTVSQGARYCNIYVGYGLRDQGSPFSPLSPGDVQDEPQDDGDEANEPNPDEEVLSDLGDEDEAVEGEEKT